MKSAAETIEECLIDKTNIGRANAAADEVIASLELAGYVIVPKILTEDMADAMECAFSTEAQWEAAIRAGAQ